MAPVILRFVVKFSSQDSKHPVENILRNGEPKKWLCAKGTKTGTLEASFQLEKECIISAVHVGNHGSSFIELSVGRSDWPQDKEYVTLMPTSSLIPPKDAKIWERVDTVKMYKKENFVSGASDQLWDRLKVRCSQPWRKDKQFGLTFLRVHTMDEAANQSASNDAESSEIGSERLKQRYMEITGASREGIVANPRTPVREELYSRSERIFKATLTPKSGPETPGSDQKPCSNFYAELESFLRDLNVNQVMDDDLQVSDLRQKIEKILCRPLTKPEKKIFRQRVPEYIQEFLDRAERKVKRRKAAAKLEYTMSTSLPEMTSPPSRTPSQKSSGRLDYESVFADVTELADRLTTPESKPATKKSATLDNGRRSLPSTTAGTKMKTPKMHRTFSSSDEESKPKFSAGRSFLKKEQPKPSTSSHDNQDYYINHPRKLPEKKPKTDYSSSGGFLASDEILNRLGQNRGPIVLENSPTTARRGNGPPRGIKRERGGHQLPPVISMGASNASPGGSRRVVPAIHGRRRIKHLTVQNSITDVHPSCLPEAVQAAQGPGRQLQSNRTLEQSNSGKSTLCPLCNENFPSSTIEEHAATCDGLPDITPSRSDDVIIQNDVASGSGNVHDVPCPMCGLSFSGVDIEAHADLCADRGGAVMPIELY